MMTISIRRMLLAAAAASCLVALMAPQAASAAEVRCQGYRYRGCQTNDLWVGFPPSVSGRIYFRLTAQKGGRPARGAFEVRRNGFRVVLSRFYGSAYGQVTGQRGRYKLHVWSDETGAVVAARLWAARLWN
jgi:hypothetical protein